MLGVGILAGIGFTMALFVAGLAFADPRMLDAARMGVLAASTNAAIGGAALLYHALPAASGRRSARP